MDAVICAVGKLLTGELTPSLLSVFPEATHMNPRDRISHVVPVNGCPWRAHTVEEVRGQTNYYINNYLIIGMMATKKPPGSYGSVNQETQCFLEGFEKFP